MKPDQFKSVIISSFEGRNTPLQQTLIAEWLQQPANLELYYQWLEEWERANPQFLPDTDVAFRRSLQQAGPAEVAQVVPMPGRQWGRWLMAASVLVVLSSIGWLLRDNIRYRNEQTAYGELRTLTLPDGSRVTLNANTRLRLPRWRFGTGSREVWLTGEAEFSVQHLPEHQPFVVHTPDGLNVHVLGTEFVVYSRARGTKVVLTKGRVQLQNARADTAKPLLMLPGDVVMRPANGQLTLRHRQPLPVHTVWKNHQFAFNNTPVAEVAYRIREQFGVTVILADTGLANRRIGGTFSAQTADELLIVVAQLLGADVVKTNSLQYQLSTNP
ncbi:FecR family protein [Spirosoma montaniterrae]|uniref:Uncharacterized protein n=1 Tax=Spirosoma montaniterrae TaxID=1178516 RepID=A0A1P9WRT7_9BACT|nr:FecR domain-containing protein [Spirosoma montaniterrae]AQG78060.1 hypothetical protein AWR27_01055 [Spirosoma montaniterrae]